MRVPLLDLTKQFEAYKSEFLSALDEVVPTQKFILGAPVENLEKEIAAYTGAKHAIGCASGSDALLLSFWALDIGREDAVVTTPFTFFATAGSIWRLGALPLFVDIDPDTFNIDPKALENFFKNECEPGKAGKPPVHKKTGRVVKASCPVHLYGQCADIESIVATCKKHSVHVVEDCCQSIGSHYGKAMSGTFGATGCFSFFPSKNLGGWGDGGIMTTNDPALAERLKMLRVHGGLKKYYHNIVGMNSRLDALQAVVLRVKLRHLNDWIAGRQKKADNYRRLFEEMGLSGAKAKPQLVKAPVVVKNCDHTYHQFVIRVSKRDELREFLKKNEIDSEIYYPVPLHMQECFKDLGYVQGDFPVSEKACQEVLALPIYSELTDDQQRHVAQTIRKFYVA
jgi:dTDP-4-amino-4,6-dideoxygalactose transaminase